MTAITLTSTGLQQGSNTLNTTPVDTGEAVLVTTFTSSGTYTVPSNATTILVQMVGGGGGGCGYCESGGGGGYAEGMYSVSGGAQYSVTVGGGGGGAGYYTSPCPAGGTTSFGSLLSASGGGGANSYITHAGGHGGSGSGGQVNLTGGSGTGHVNHGSHNQNSDGGSSYFGGGPGHIRSHQTQGYSWAPGSGGCGDMTYGYGSGASGASGIVIVHAFM
jgi:hypothetical protein